MQPLNPFLRAFFKSNLPSQCTPVQHHVLLVPTTDVLLTSRDRESGALFADLAGSEDFLASHVLRIQGNAASTAGGKDAPNMREIRGKAKQYTTINNRTVVIKDSLVYSNKGFKTLTQAQLLHDAIWYPDTLEPRPWLIYYISRPLAGIYEEIKIPQAIIASNSSEGRAATANNAAQGSQSSKADSALPRKKEISTFSVSTFSGLLNSFPMIARQMQPGLERLFKEFKAVFDKPLPPPPSAPVILDPKPDGQIVAAMKKARSNSSSSIASTLSNGHDYGGALSSTYTEDEEYDMRGALETAVTSAIDLFQMVDKQQLSLLGATTDLTGPVVERLIERYIAEQVHDTILYPRLCALKRVEDLDLESKIRQMEFIDISQVGIPIQGGNRGKHEINLRLGRAVDEFRKLGVAGSPQEMMDILLLTLKTVTQISDQPMPSQTNDSYSFAASEKISPVLTINADTLVSLLLVVVIRAQVRYLQARLSYMRHFIFIDDVESGEMGYALSTLEAVLSYLARDSVGIRRASKRNKKLWQATIKGEIHEMIKIMEPDATESPDALDEHELDQLNNAFEGYHDSPWNERNENLFRRSSSSANSERLSQASTLNHVFPFQIVQSDAIQEQDSPIRRRKTVTMNTRSMSISSEASLRSKATTIDSTISGIEGDTSVEKLSQTEDSSGESVLMMAVQHERPDSLKYLLSLEEYYPLQTIIDDTNNEGTTLLSAAVQLGHRELIDIIFDFVSRLADKGTLIDYVAKQDSRGRSMAHYLFNAPSLIPRVGNLLYWRQKDKNGQTPLFALCRSYDHSNYSAMVEAGLKAASEAQEDGLPLHLDDHVDAKGNTLLHVVNDSRIAAKLLFECDSDVNATNDKKFTSLMVASKYGRTEMVRTFFRDPRVDLYAKDIRGLTAVELAKDDEVRNRIDDLALFYGSASREGRITAVVRSYFVEDATIRLVVKSAAPTSEHGGYTVTTSRRSLADFESLAKLLSLEHPASWLPSVSGILRTPFQIPSKPSRAVLRDIQVRLDDFLRVLLTHSTFATHEMLWEFFLVPEMRAEMMEKRSRLKAEARLETVRDEYEPVEDVRDVEQFVDHARETVRSVNYSTKSVARRTNALRVVTSDLYDAHSLFARSLSGLAFLPDTHVSAFAGYARTLAPGSSTPHARLHAAVLSAHSTIIAMLLALSRPTTLVASMAASRRAIERSHSSLSRSTRWPLGLLDETRQRLNEERERAARRASEELRMAGRELRYAQGVVAAELAGWQETHERAGRRALREFARATLVLERERLAGLRRALRSLRPEGGRWRGDGGGGGGGGSGGSGANAGDGLQAAATSGSGRGQASTSGSGGGAGSLVDGDGASVAEAATPSGSDNMYEGD